jgi:hypothetical protein
MANCRRTGINVAIFDAVTLVRTHLRNRFSRYSSKKWKAMSRVSFQTFSRGACSWIFFIIWSMHIVSRSASYTPSAFDGSSLSVCFHSLTPGKWNRDTAVSALIHWKGARIFARVGRNWPKVHWAFLRLCPVGLSAAPLFRQKIEPTSWTNVFRYPLYTTLSGLRAGLHAMVKRAVFVFSIEPRFSGKLRSTWWTWVSFSGTLFVSVFFLAKIIRCVFSVCS